MASCGAGAPHRPGGAARLPPFSCLSPEVPDDSLPSPPLPADAFPRPFFVRLHAEEAKACEGRRGKRYGLCPGRGSAQGRPGRGGRAEGIRRQAAETPQNRPQSTPEKDEKRPRLRAQKKTRSVGIRHCGSLSTAPAEERLLTHGFRGHTPFGSDAVRKTDRTYVRDEAVVPGAAHGIMRRPVMSEVTLPLFRISGCRRPRSCRPPRGPSSRRGSLR